MSEEKPGATSGDALAIVCGGGSLPFAVADAAVRRGRRVVLFALRGWADPQRVAAYPHHWSRMGQLGHFLRVAEKERCRDVVLIGSVTRPSLWQMRPDWRALRFMPRILRLFRGGDDRLQSGIGRIFEQHGFRLLGPYEVAPELLMPSGALGNCRPSGRDWSDVRRGLALLRATSSFDIGQAAVVADNQVLALEGPEGTDQMLARVVELRRNGRIQAAAGSGVLIKAPKVGQNMRIDLPSIGPQTVDGVAAAALAGIAVIAGTTLVAELDRIAAAADEAEIFVVGVSSDGTPP